MNQFTADYYERGRESGLSLYENYRWLPELTVPMAQALISSLDIKPTDSVLDFGCAKGYLVKALRSLGRAAWGCDISEYALSQADRDTEMFLFHADELWAHYDLIICKDVLEHVAENELRPLLRELRSHTYKIFVAVPLGNNGKYTIPEMELDVTHRIRRPLWWWAGELEAAGFPRVKSSFSMHGIKENWTRKYQFGNGFLIAQ